MISVISVAMFTLFKCSAVFLVFLKDSTRRSNHRERKHDSCSEHLSPRPFLSDLLDEMSDLPMNKVLQDS